MNDKNAEIVFMQDIGIHPMGAARNRFHTNIFPGSSRLKCYAIL